VTKKAKGGKWHNIRAVCKLSWMKMMKLNENCNQVEFKESLSNEGDNYDLGRKFQKRSGLSHREVKELCSCTLQAILHWTNCMWPNTTQCGLCNNNSNRTKMEPRLLPLETLPQSLQWRTPRLLQWRSSPNNWSQVDKKSSNCRSLAV